MSIKELVSKFNDKLVIFSLLSLLLSLLFYWLSTGNKDNYSDIYVGIASGLFTTFLVSILTRFVNSDVQADLIAKKVSTRVVKDINSTELVEFDPTDDWRSDFNRSLTINLRTSGNYYFKGLTGHHFSLRILGLLGSKDKSFPLEKAKLIILFPDNLQNADFRLIHESRLSDVSAEEELKHQIISNSRLAKKCSTISCLKN